MAAWQCALCEATSTGALVRRSTRDRAICTWCETELARTSRKRCRTCNVVRPVAEYTTDRQSPDGRSARCRACRKVANDAWRARSKDHLRAYQVANRERQRAYRRQWRDANRERVRAIWRRADRVRRQRYPGAERERKAAYERTHRAQINARRNARWRGRWSEEWRRRKLRFIRRLRGL